MSQIAVLLASDAHQPLSHYNSFTNKQPRHTRPALRVSTLAGSAPRHSETAGASSSTRAGSSRLTPIVAAPSSSRDPSRDREEPSSLTKTPPPIKPSRFETQGSDKRLPRASSRTQRAATIGATSPLAPHATSTISFPYRQSRAPSVYSSHSLTTPRARVFSLSSLGADSVPKAEVSTPVAVEGEETIGSFAPTSCPRAHIRSLLGSISRPKIFSVARRRLTFGNSSPLSINAPHPFDDASETSSLTDSSPPGSPLPSISRTPSSETQTDFDCVSTAPSSAGPVTPIHSTSASPSLRNISLTTPAVLAALEEQSKFRVRTSCSACHKPGSNYPCCPRCGEMWCSRECRLKSTNGKKHVCKR